MKNILHIIPACMLMFCSFLGAQAPVNDDCENAIEIIIPSYGFSFDTISSPKTNVQKATRQQAEHCASELEENGNCVKTVWYKFYLPTTRNIGIKLTQQDSAIPQIFSGFNIYKINNCSYTMSDLAKQLTPLNKFGISGNSCLSQGWYLIQIGCKQRAKGDIWLDLEVSKPAAEPYDNISGLYDFSLNPVVNSTRLMIGCASVDQAESQQLGDSSLSKSVWLAYRIDAGSEKTSLTISGNARYRIFHDQIHPDSLKSNKPFRQIVSGGQIVSEYCPGINKIRKYYVQIVSDNNTEFVDVNFESKILPKDKWNTTNTDVYINLEPGIQKNSVNTFNCESKLELHSCKNIIPKSFIKPYKNWNDPSKPYVDTFTFGAYIVLNVTEAGLLNIRNFHIGRFLFTLYEGDVRSSCQLNYVSDTICSYYSSLTKCIGKGVYTLVVASKMAESTGDIIFNLYPPPLANPKFTYAHLPEKLPDYPISARQSIQSEVSSFRSTDTSLTISNMTFKGAFIYREIFIPDGGDIEIGIEDQKEGNIHIFSGRFTDGTISAIPELDYGRFYRSTNDMIRYLGGGHVSCFNLPRGYYTILSMDSYDKLYQQALPCQVRFNQIYIRPAPVCPAGNNTEPPLAFVLNSGKNVLDTTSSSGTLSYVYTLNSCNFCSTRSKIIPQISCRQKKNLNPFSTYHYYTFYLDENASMSINSSAYELFEGDVIKNPAIIKDSTRIIDPCENGQQICNLQGKRIYTLVIFNQYNEVRIAFSRHITSANDFADHAYDIGHIAGNNVTSPFFPITCHTNGFVSDPAPPDMYVEPGNTTAIRFPDTLNNKGNYRNRRNIWFTFTSSGVTNINIRFQQLNYYGQSNYFCFVMRYKGPYRQNFSDVLSDGLDSTMNGMEPIANSIMTLSNPSFSFTNPGCGENRYFVLISRNSYWSGDLDLNTEHGINITSKTESHPIEGDQCHQAVKGQYKKPGNYTLTADNTCHTYGGSPFEDDYDPKIKTTWFRIKVDSLKKFDLKIRSSAGSGLLSYNVYGGTCKAMTRIARQGDRYAYFELSCMGEGEYYIQAISLAATNDILSFEVSIIDAGQSPCKPYDFKYPIAQFTYYGGCQNNDSIKFTNLSTRGEDISYDWQLNGLTFSTEAHPLLFRTDTFMSANNTFRLIVTNTAENARDTFDLDYKLDTTIYRFMVKVQEYYLCRDSLRLHVTTDYPGKINYTWYNSAYNLLSDYSVFKQDYVYGARYYVHGESDHCRFRDSFDIKVLNSLNRYKDTFACGWRPYIFRNKDSLYPAYLYFISSSQQEYISIPPSGTHTAAKNGLYIFSYYVNQCLYADSVNVYTERGPQFLKITENIYACNISSRPIAYKQDTLLNYIWNTGDTTPVITATKSGTYKLTGRFSKCRSLEYTTNLTLENINTDLLRDTVVCKYDDFPFDNPYGGKFKINYKQPNKDTIHVREKLMRTLYVQRSECIVRDSSVIDIFPYEGRTIDSFYCDEKLNFHMLIDGGNARAYNWYLQQQTQRYLDIFNYGNYPVARTDTYGCRDTLNFNIITDCEFTVFVPTAFSPGNDLVNESFEPHISGRFLKYNMVLFNNWGEQVFTTDHSESWSGLYKEHYNQGVYCYLITVYNEDNKPFRFKGTVTLLR
jgi:hypothetical protein